MYIMDNMRRCDIAKFYGCSDVRIKQLLAQFGIKKEMSLINENRKRRTHIRCLYCKNEFEIKNFRKPGNKWELKFCSMKCSSASRYLGSVHKRKKANEIAARRRSRINGASVGLTEAELGRIEQIYLNCPVGYEVDHKIPISKGGKHHPDNLQYLTRTDNRRKHNKCLDQL